MPRSLSKRSEKKLPLQKIRLQTNPATIDPWKKKIVFPDQSYFLGQWILNQNSNLLVKARDRSMTDGEKIVAASAQLLKAKADSLSIKATGRQKNGRQLSEIIELSGEWRANSSNELEFLIKNKKGSQNCLLLKGSWKISGSQEIIYEYEKTNLKTKKKIRTNLLLKGHWDILENARLLYVLDDQEKRIAFTASLKTSLMRAQDKTLDFVIEFGGMKNKRNPLQTISLKGGWKRKKGKIYFSFSSSPDKNKEISFQIKRVFLQDRAIFAEISKNKSTGAGFKIELERISEKLSKKYFIKYSSNGADFSISGGAQFMW